ncbi:MAG: hypothetical protein ISS81_10460 [Candidatus Marinimicrobia bacterium]|nr:hypothetical protein [Candidatus Neomarinimicrobiota bacterium]
MLTFNHKILTILLIAISINFSGCNKSSEKGDSFGLRQGDLLFQDLDCGPFCDAIEKVTQGYNGANFSHIGIVAGDSIENFVVIEAQPTGVDTTHLEVFLRHSLDLSGQPKVVVGRLKQKYRNLIPSAIGKAYSLIGKPYDKVFDINNDAYYCSELIYEIFLFANNGKPIFKLQPMTFKDPATDNTFPVWKEYFSELEVSIPEGEPGINPGSISYSSIINIVHYYGIPSGWK